MASAPTPASFCPSGHSMTEWADNEFSQLYNCTSCGALSQTNDVGLTCKPCDFNRCVGCISTMSGNVCPKGHALGRHTLGPQASCDKCGQFIGNVPTQLVCLACDYVFCHRCCIAGATGDKKTSGSAAFAASASAALGSVPSLTYDASAAFQTMFNASAAGPAKGLHWYKATMNVGGYFTMPDCHNGDCSWLLLRPTHQVYFQDGLLADVTSAFGTRFEIAQASQLAAGEEIYFTLPEWFPSPADAPKEMLQYAPFPEEYIKPSDRSAGAASPAASGDIGGYSDLEGFLAAYRSRKDEDDFCTPFGIIGEGSWKYKVASLVSTILLVGFAILAFWINLVICQTIGKNASHWAMVFLWLFLGLLGYAALFTLIAYFIPRLIGGDGDERNHPISKSIMLAVLLFVFSCSFGAPLAWTEAQMRTGDNYMAVDKLKTLNCWRNPREKFDQINNHFIVFEEADWIVDYKLRYNQGVSTLTGTDNEGSDDGKRFNFCLAPMAYRGLPDCPQNFYAACFRETSMTFLASCDDNDAKTCGWDFPSAMNLIRTMNRNEQFWSNLEEEDETYWRSALGFVTPFHASPVSSVMGFYSGEGPSEIQAYVDTADALQDALFLGGMLSFSLLCLLVVFFTNCMCDEN